MEESDRLLGVAEGKVHAQLDSLHAELE